MKKYSILSYEQMSYNPIFYKEQLSVFDIRTQVLAELTDLAILQGARVSNVNYSKSFFHRDRELILRTKKDRKCGVYWLNAKSGDYNYDFTGNSDRDDRLPDDWTRFDSNTEVVLSNIFVTAKPNETDIATRITVPYSEIKNECTKKEIDEIDKKLEVEFGEYPQTIVSDEIQEQLEQKYQENTLSKTNKVYTWNKTHNEYEFKNNKYIRFENENQEHVWIKVEPVRWWVDEEKDVAVTEKGLFAGIPFDNKKEYNGDFSKTNLKNYIDKYFSKEIEPSKLQNPKTDYNIEDILNGKYNHTEIKQLTTDEKIEVVTNLTKEVVGILKILRSFSKELGKDFGRLFDNQIKEYKESKKMKLKK